jgi:hypothetical protein
MPDLRRRLDRLEAAAGPAPADEPGAAIVPGLAAATVPGLAAAWEEIRRLFPNEPWKDWPGGRREFFFLLGELLVPYPELRGRFAAALEAQILANEALARE